MELALCYVMCDRNDKITVLFICDQRPLRCEASQWQNITICCAVLSAPMRLVLGKNQEINDLPSCVIANNNTKIASINTHYLYTFHLGIKY